MYHWFLIHASTNGNLECFQHLAVVSHTAMNIGLHRLFWIGDSGFLQYNPSRRIPGSKGSSTFSSLRKFHTVFHSGCTSLYSHQQCTKVPFSLQTRQHLFFLIILLLFKYCCLHLPHTTPPPQPFLPPSPDSIPSWFCPYVLYSCSWNPVPLTPPIILSFLPSA